MKFIFWIAVIFFFAIANHSCSLGGGLVRVQPDSLFGSWRADRTSLNGGSAVSLKLSPDYSFQLVDAPLCWVLWNRECSGAISVTGTWNLTETTQGYHMIILKLPDRKEIRTVEIFRQEELKLRFNVGDPDAGRMFIMTKAE